MFKIRDGRSKIGQFVCLLALSTACGAYGESLVGKFVVVGDSLSAGFQNFSLFDDTGAVLFGPNNQPFSYTGGQKSGYANQIATQAGAKSFSNTLPLIAWPGIPPAIGSGRTDVGLREPDTQGTQTLNLSVPGYLLADALGRIVDTTTFSSPANQIDLMAFQVLAYPSITKANPLSGCGVVKLSPTKFLLSEAACAVKEQPDTLILWIGNNDALQALTMGIPPTNPTAFRTEYDLLLTTLKASGAKLVIANVPDVTHLPFLFQCSVSSYVVPNIANPPAPADLPNACTTGVNSGHFLSVPASLVGQTQNAVLAYNAIIAAEARKFHATLVDVYDVFEKINTDHGYPIGGVTLGNGPFGGLFSWDLIHPTNSANAILANVFIKAMNAAIQPGRSQIPQVCVNHVAAADFLALLTPDQRMQLGNPAVCVQ